MDKLGINLSSHVSTPIDKKTAEKSSILIAMDNKTRQALLILFPNQIKKIHVLTELVNEDKDIIDPQGVSGIEKQEQILTEIQEIIVRGFPKLLTMI